jgi:hypothetical protein
MLKMPAILEIGNPDHISAVLSYELQHGYDRRRNVDGIEVDKRFSVVLTASVRSVAKATIEVEAMDEDLAGLIAAGKVHENDFSTDSFEEENDLSNIEIENIEEISGD